MLIYSVSPILTKKHRLLIMQLSRQQTDTEKRIPVNEGEEYTEEKLVEMFTKPEWVSDNSGTATFKVDKWGLEHGLDGYQPFTSKTPGEYKVRFYAYDAAGNNSSFDVYVKVLEPEVEERTTTVNYYGII